MLTIELKNSEWLRGEGGGTSRLRRSNDGKKCCLGELGIVCGLHEAIITDITSYGVMHPHISLPTEMQFLVKDWTGASSDTAHALMIINDVKNTSDEEKVIALNEIANGYGINFVFNPDA